MPVLSGVGGLLRRLRSRPRRVERGPRRRLAGGLLVMLGAVAANVFLDYRLVLCNPEELKAIVDAQLQKVAPELDLETGPLQLSLLDRVAVIHDVTFRERGGAHRELIHVQRLEARFGLFALRELILDGPSATIRLDPAGHLDLPGGIGGADAGAVPPGLSQVEVSVRRGWVRILDDSQGARNDLFCGELEGHVSRHDGSLTATGTARAGVLFDLADPRASAGSAPPGTPSDRRYADVFPEAEFQVRRAAGGPWQVEVALRHGMLSPALQSVIPAYFRRTIWSELNPSGGQIDIALHLEQTGDGTHLNAQVRPRGVTICPRGFPIPITDLTGPFEVVLGRPAHGRPDILQVSWEGLRGRVAGGECTARGAAWPGRPEERVTMCLFIDAARVELTPELVQAMPPEIRAVYRRFDAQGRVARAQVTILKGPASPVPSISVQVAQLQGSVSASYEDYAVRLRDVTGSFSLREGANVEVHARGRLDLGGQAEVEARVMHGELLHVEVRGRGVPIGARLLRALSPGIREYVQPFHLEGGQADFAVVVDKRGPHELARPHVEVDLHGVTAAHDRFPFRLAARGRVVVDPVFPSGAAAEDRPAPSRLQIGLDLGLERPGAVAGARIQGTLSAPLGEGELSGDLSVAASRVELSRELLAALPSALQGVAAELRPAGAVVHLAGRVRALDRLELSAGGDGLLLAPGPELQPGVARRFQVAVDRVRLRCEGRRLQLLELAGRLPGGGTLDGLGEVLLTGPGEDLPTLALDLDAVGAGVDERVLELVPRGAARDLLARLDPRGRLDAQVHLRSGAGLPAQHSARLTLQGVQLRLQGLDPALAGLEHEPLRDVHGVVRLELPGDVELIGLRGRLAGAELALAGTVGTPPEVPPPTAQAALGGAAGAVGGLLLQRLGPPLDLVMHLGGLEVDPQRTAALGGPPLRQLLGRFPARGLLDLSARLQRPAFAAAPTLRVRAEPRGLHVAPGLLPVPCEDVAGEVELIDGTPVRIDLTGKVGQGTFRVRRDRHAEAGLPGGGSRGMALGVELHGLERPADPGQWELSAHLRAAIDALDPRGPIDVLAQLYLPRDPGRAISWVAELSPHGLALTTGVRLEGITGVVRASGRVTRLEGGTAEGELEIAGLTWNLQALSHLRGRFRLRHGLLSIGVRGAPFAAELYGGRLTGLVEYDIPAGTYEGHLHLVGARLAECAEELGKLRPGKSAPREHAIEGQLAATLDFAGGPTRRFLATGQIQALRANLIQVPGVDVFRALTDAFRGRASDQPMAFETMQVRYHMNGPRNSPDWRLRLDEVRLNSPAIFLVGRDGWVRFSDVPERHGDIKLDLVPFETGPFEVIRYLLLENLIPLLGYSIRGKVWDVHVVTGIPFFRMGEDVYRTMTEGNDREEDD